MISSNLAVTVAVLLLSIDTVTEAFSTSPKCMPARGRTTSSRLHLFDFLKPQEGDEDGKEEDASDVAPVSDDPVDKIFGFFFGTKEEEPMGMKRFGRGEFCFSSTRTDHRVVG